MEMGGQYQALASSAAVNKPSSHFKGGWVYPRFSLDRYGEEKFLASTMV